MSSFGSKVNDVAGGIEVTGARFRSNLMGECVSNAVPSQSNRKPIGDCSATEATIRDIGAMCECDAGFYPDQSKQACLR